MQHFPGQDIADAGDGAGCAAIDEAMKHGGIDTDHHGNLVVLTGDVLGGVAHVCRAAEFLEASKIGMLGPQGKEEVRPGGKTIIGTVVDDGGKFGSSREESLEVCFLCRNDGAA